MGAPAGAHPKALDLEISPESLLRAVISVSDDAIFTLDREETSPAGAPHPKGSSDSEPATCSEVPSTRSSRSTSRSLSGRWFRGLLQASPSSTSRARSSAQTGCPCPCGSLYVQSPIHGVTVAAAVIAKDVTEQRLAQASLAEVEARLGEGESLAHVGSWLWDLRTGTTQWSSEFHRIHGVDPLDFDGTFEFHLSVIHPADRSAIREAMETSVESGLPFESEYRVVRPDHQVRVLHVRAHPTIGSAGTAVGLRGIGQDVTESVLTSGT